MDESTQATKPAKPVKSAAAEEPRAVDVKAAGAENVAPERFIPAAPARFMTSVEYKAPHVWYCPEAGTPFEHLLRPEYWANLSTNHLRTNAHIFVDAEDGSYFAELKVLKVAQGYAKVFTLRHVELAAASADPALPDGYEIQFRGPIVKHRVVRLKDSHVLKQGLDTEDEARAWLRDHKRMLAA